MAGAIACEDFAAAQPRRGRAGRADPDGMHPQGEPKLFQLDVQRGRQRGVERAGRKFQAQAAVADVEQPGLARTDRGDDAGHSRARPAPCARAGARRTLARVEGRFRVRTSVANGRARYMPPRRLVSVSSVTSNDWSMMTRRTDGMVGARAERQVEAVELPQPDVRDEQRQLRHREQTPSRFVERRHGIDRVTELCAAPARSRRAGWFRFDQQRGRAHVVMSPRLWFHAIPLRSRLPNQRNRHVPHHPNQTRFLPSVFA